MKKNSIANVNIPRRKLVNLAKRYRLKELSLFGSVLSSSFGPDSDIDVLIEFSPNIKASLFDLVDIKDELESIFERNVDLVEKTGLRNPFRRRAILLNCEVIYAA